jgi:hypothetical protein
VIGTLDCISMKSSSAVALSIKTEVFVTIMNRMFSFTPLYISSILLIVIVIEMEDVGLAYLKKSFRQTVVLVSLVSGALQVE